ncbi:MULTISPECIES: hypothetical protein [Olivibacter]|uniref:Transposase n=1 Tax=Olivibacter jilunii TaxID=985016 RepID=A0ABW6AW03_9SPHI
MRYMKRKWTDERKLELIEKFNPNFISSIASYFRVSEEDLCNQARKLRLYNNFKRPDTVAKPKIGRPTLTAEQKEASKRRQEELAKQKKAEKKKRKPDMNKEPEKKQEYVRKPFTPYMSSKDGRVLQLDNKTQITLRPGADPAQVIARFQARNSSF